MNKFRTRVWHWAALILIALELIGVRARTSNDTLSEYIWSKTNHPTVRGMVGGVAGWLPYHFTYGRGIPLSYWDLAFVAGGIGMGVHSWWIRRGE